MEPEKRRISTITQAQLEEVAERGAARALEKMTTHVFIFIGKGIVERAFWIVGILTVTAYFWLQSRGLIK